MKDNFIDKLNEKVYSARIGDSKEEIVQILYYFFDELVKRKRKKTSEGGLHAGLVIDQDSFGAKINEDDGKHSHLGTSINLVKYLNKDDYFITDKAIGNSKLYKDALNQLSTQSVESRIVAGDRKLVMTFVSNHNALTNFQLDILESIAFACKLLVDNAIYDDINIGFRVGKSELMISSWNEEAYRNILQLVEKERKRVDKRLIKKYEYS